MMKTKRALSLVVVLSMILSMFGNFTAFADVVYNDTDYKISFALGADVAAEDLAEYEIELQKDGVTIYTYPLDEGSIKNGITQKLDIYSNMGLAIAYTIKTPDFDGKYEATVTGPDENYEFTVAIAKIETEKTFKLKVQMTNDGKNVDNGTYHLEYGNKIVADCYSGVAKEVTADVNSDIKIVFSRFYGYEKYEDITFNVNDLEDSDKFTKDEDGVYVKTVELTAVESEPEYTHENHPICGAECDGNCVEGEHSDLTWTPLSVALTKENEEDSVYKLAAGNYCLNKDITLAEDEHIQLTGDVNICLNGFKLQGNSSFEALIQNYGYKLNFTDCSADNSGAVVNDTGEVYVWDGAVKVNGGKVSIYGGKYTDNTKAIYCGGGELNIYGGEFNAIGTGASACVDLNASDSTAKNATVNIYGGTFNVPNAEDAPCIYYTDISSAVNVYGGTYNAKSGNAYYVLGRLFVYNLDTLNQAIKFGTITNNIQLFICEKLNKPAKKWNIVLDEYAEIDPYCDLTGWWSDKMNSEDPAEYFACNRGVVALNPDTNEAHIYDSEEDIPYKVSIDGNIKNGKVEAGVTSAKKNDTVTLTVTPDKDYKLNTISAKDGDGNTVNLTKATEEGISTQSASEEYTFTMPAKAVSVTADFNFDTPFTVKAVVNSATEDVDADKDGTQVNAKDTVKVDVAVSGGAFTNADWEMIYDPTLFEYVGTTENTDVTAKGTVTTDDTKTAVLSGKLIANAGISAGDEFTADTAIVTYEFTAKAQNADKVGTFKIESAHANNYVIAGKNDNKVANTENTTVEIVLVDNTEDKDEGNSTVTVPAGTFTAAEKVYNAQKQTGNAFELDEDFAGAKVTYFANEDGTAVENTADLASKSFKTTLPSWKDVGTYTYYAKIYGDGLKTTYVSTTLTITQATLVPSAMFTVDPSTGTNDVEFVPTLEGALDGTHNGTVTVTYTDKDGAQSVELQASDFVYDGETTSVYNGTIKTTAATSGEFTVTLTYEDGTNDNYTGGTNTAKVDVDKITANKVTVDALEETITSVFGYDSTAHSVEINADVVTTVTNGDWKYTISDEDATVTNVGDDKMVKVTFMDKNNVYNDVIVYVILKVTPANVKITVDDQTKVMNEDDPELTGTVQVVDEDGNAVEGMDANKLYGEDDLEVSYEREAGEAVGTYDITASYAPNDNYTVEVENGTFTITAPVIDPDDETKAIVKVEVVDLSKGNTNGDETPDYTANKRLILVYTDVDKLFYGYKVDENTTEKMFDVTAAGYKYVDNDYEAGTYTEDTHEYKHVYGIVVDAIDNYEATETYEKKYRDNVVFLSSDLSDAPVNIVYDGDINLSNEIDVNDYSMTNGIYNNQYARATYIKNILKADINGDKKVDTTDVANVKGIYEAKN